MIAAKLKNLRDIATKGLPAIVVGGALFAACGGAGQNPTGALSSVMPTAPSGPSLTLSGTPVVASVRGDEITICHRTSSVKNPYVQITVDQSAVDGDESGQGNGDHFARHTGPVFDPANPQDNWGDIIPPILGVHEGLNWPAGEATLANGCEPASGDDGGPIS